MSCLKVLIIVFSCTVAFGLSVAADEQDDVSVLDSKQKFCGESLDRAIDEHCVDVPRRLVFQPSKNQPTNKKNTLVGRYKIRGEKHGFLQKKCCDNECSINFIKSNCPGTRNSEKTKKIEIAGRQPITARTMTTARPQQTIPRFGKDKTTSSPTITSTTPRSTKFLYYNYYKVIT